MQLAILTTPAGSQQVRFASHRSSHIEPAATPLGSRSLRLHDRWRRCAQPPA